MKKLFNILRIQLAVAVAYRGTIFFWLSIHLIGFIVMNAFWTAVFSDRPLVNEFNLGQMLQYILLTNLIREFVLVAPEYEINDAIRDGKLASALLRPFSYPLHTLLASTFWHIIESILAIVVYGAVALLVLPQNIWDFSWSNVFAVLPIIVLGHICCSFFSLILGSLAFWLTEGSAFFYYKEILILITSGLFFPKATTPLWFQGIMEILPFYHAIGIPAEVLVNKTMPAALSMSYLVLVVWIVILISIATVVWNRGVSRFESIGN